MYTYYYGVGHVAVKGFGTLHEADVGGLTRESWRLLVEE